MHKLFAKKGFSSIAEWLNAPWGLKIHICKKVPSPAGLGGGSSNSAFIIHFFLKKIKDLFPESNIQEIKKILINQSLNIGADIPYFIENKPALISGKGKVHSTFEMPTMKGILGIPDFGFSTRQMYNNLKRALQDEKSSSFVQDIHIHYKNFFNKLNKRDINSKDTNLVLEQLNEKSYQIKNDFLMSVKTTDSEDSKLLFKALNFLIKNLYEKIKEIEIYYSMSGSGSSLYSLILNKKNQDISYLFFDDFLGELKETLPMINWLPFSIWNPS